MRIPTRLKAALAAASIASIAMSGVASAATTTIYNNIPSPTPGNVPSVGFEATQTSQFGDRIAFSIGTSRTVTAVTVLMSSWGCQSGHWYSADCVTAAGATFSHPITLNLYNVAGANAVGSLIGSVTQTFAIPYRPSASPSCSGGRWSDGTTCYNGYATPITFNIPALLVPNEVIVGIAYNTTHYGAAPIGESAPCYTSSGGCGYDSLNVGTTGAPASVGVNPAPSDAYLNSATGGQYCDGGIGGVNVFRLDAGCWTGYKPAIKVTATLPSPATKDDCKDGGWQNLYGANGPFKNQGDCVQFANTGK